MSVRPMKHLKLLVDTVTHMALVDIRTNRSGINNCLNKKPAEFSAGFLFFTETLNF